MNWYVVQCNVGKEYKAQQSLELYYEGRTYLPEIKVDKRLFRRSKRDTQPAFPGYVFLQLNQTTDDWSMIKYNQSTSCISGVVRRGDYIPYLNDDFINAFISFENHPTDYEIGEAVVVNCSDHGFINVPAIMEKTGTERVRVMMEFVGGKRSMELDRYDVTPIN